MRIGQRRIIATLQRRNVTDDGVGGETVRFAPVAVLHLGIIPQPGREFYAAKKLNSDLTHEVEIRYRDDLAADMRFVFGKTVLNIESFFDRDSKHRKLTIFCRQVLT